MSTYTELRPEFFEPARSWFGADHDALVTVDINPSDQAGYFHYSVSAVKQSMAEDSIRPVRPSFFTDPIFRFTEYLSDQFAAENVIWKEAAPNQVVRAIKERQRPEAFGPVVYFMGAGPFVKIGRTEVDPAQRISELQTGCPYRITLLATVPGGHQEESEYHRRFSAYRTQGEWFLHEGSLRDHLVEIAR